MAYHDLNRKRSTAANAHSTIDARAGVEVGEEITVKYRNGRHAELEDVASHWDEVAYYDELAAALGYEDEEPAVTGKIAKTPRPAPRNSRTGLREARIMSELAGNRDMFDEVFETTYKPAKYEEVWLNDSLRPLVQRGLIRDVLMLVKGGKEANVYLCEGEPKAGHALVAAKVYRPRQFRNLRNDAMYREGREILNSQGNTIKAQTTNRIIRAVNKKTDFGAEILHESWLAYEYGTLAKLYAIGAAVPEPILSGGNSILMEYIGDRSQAAPLLHSVSLEAQEAVRLCDEVLDNIELMLRNNMVHGDLSAYNILYWQGKITMIDFPQVTSADKNNNAWFILQRDVQRVCEYFATQGVEQDADAIARDLWQRHVRQPMPL